MTGRSGFGVLEASQGASRPAPIPSCARKSPVLAAVAVGLLVPLATVSGEGMSRLKDMSLEELADLKVSIVSKRPERSPTARRPSSS